MMSTAAQAHATYRNASTCGVEFVSVRVAPAPPPSQLTHPDDAPLRNEGHRRREGHGAEGGGHLDGSLHRPRGRYIARQQRHAVGEAWWGKNTCVMSVPAV